ncbi:very short patch repair endonuclease [Dethiobacter alkaliphilus]|uniref:very short patch repair endonuclease n=1 Tax=Dethiobacter alkaliphilus TaxID=427926 RepID=UPI002226A186|nr:very short patch repair endonuclease [Dethiobacter alkaliphilus]MCW3490228.1 very short patch repair endonuclease [Dethiobacter alkaliphilus]
MDIKSVDERSRNMAAIKSKNTKPEITLRKLLFKRGLRYRIHYNLTGKPDIVFPGKKVAVFIDGCFWHACPVCYREPNSNKEFWRTKINTNIRRDIVVNRKLANLGWVVVRIWEHEIKKDIEGAVRRIMDRM